MSIPKIFFTLVLIVNSCSNRNTMFTNNIEGFWISTEETTSQFGQGVQKVALLIKSDGAKKLSVRSFFMRNDEYKMDWKFTKVDYDSMAKRISMLDSDSDTLICNMDAENQILKGVIHSEDEISNPLIFVRADKDIASLFYPRVPDRNGGIIYNYNKPEQIDNYLQTDSIFKFIMDSTAVCNLIERIINYEFGRLESILIIKNGKLILEEYFYNYNRTKLHRINSCTKSISSLLLGITLDRHKMSNVDQSVFNFFPKYASLKTREKE